MIQGEIELIDNTNFSRYGHPILDYFATSNQVKSSFKQISTFSRDCTTAWNARVQNRRIYLDSSVLSWPLVISLFLSLNFSLHILTVSELRRQLRFI